MAKTKKYEPSEKLKCFLGETVALELSLRRECEMSARKIYGGDYDLIKEFCPIPKKTKL